MGNDLSPAPATPSNARPRRWLQRVVLIPLILATLVWAFYIIENRRGEKAWANYKKEMEAKGEHLDFDAFIPPPIPDDQNMLKVPLMERWFSRNHTNEPIIRIPGTAVLQNQWRTAHPTVLPEWVEYFYSDIISNYLVEQEKLDAVQPGEEVMPLITIEDAPLIHAIQTLAREAGLTIDIDSRIRSITNTPSVTMRLENITARQAFRTVLDNHGLMSIQDPANPTNHLKQLIVAKTNYLASEQLFLRTAASTNSLLVETNGLEVMPLIAIEDAPLYDAIKTMARQVGINFQFDPGLLSTPGLRETKVTFRHENKSTREVLADLLKQYNLTAIPSGTGVYRITGRVKTAGDILKEFEKFEPQFQELYAACKRPKARSDGDYKDLRIINFVNYRTTAQSLALRASAELALHQSDEALRDIKTCIRLADCATNDPNLVSGLIRMSMDNLIVDSIWDGLASHRWNGGQLIELQTALGEINFIPNFLYSTRAGRARDNFEYLNLSFALQREDFRHHNIKNEPLSRKVGRFVAPYVPRGWMCQNLIPVNQSYQAVLDAVDLQTNVVVPSKIKGESEKLESGRQSATPYTFIASIVAPNDFKALEMAVSCQTSINEAMIACALERYRLAHKDFPERLEALTPDLLSKIPHDIVNGQTLKYHLTDDGQYILYSVGWDEKDDNGSPSDYWQWGETGDWVWRFPMRGKTDTSKLRASRN